jgi:predicted ATPase
MALHAGPLTPLVGRDEEIDLLLRRWSQARRERAAGAGVRRTRYWQVAHHRSLLGRVAAEPHTRLRYFCSPHHRDSALHPIISQFEHVAGFDREDTAATKRDKLRAVLSLAPTTEPMKHSSPGSCPLPTDGLPSLEAASPQKRRQLLLEALVRQIESLARQEPVLLVFEDLQWIDATSLELLTLLVERSSSLRLMLVATFRPEFLAPWVGQPHVTMVTLSRLDTREAETMVESVAGGSPCPARSSTRSSSGPTACRCSSRN